MLAAGSYGIVIDDDGRVVWYRRFPNGVGLNLMTQPTGHYYARPPAPDPADVQPWLELDALGNVTRTFGCALGQRARFHDLIAEDDGSVWLLCDETHITDLADVGGNAAARVTGTTVQHVSAAGEVLFDGARSTTSWSLISMRRRSRAPASTGRMAMLWISMRTAIF